MESLFLDGPRLQAFPSPVKTLREISISWAAFPIVIHMEGTSSLLDVLSPPRTATPRPVIFTVLWAMSQELSESVLQIGIPCLRPVMWLT